MHKPQPGFCVTPLVQAPAAGMGCLPRLLSTLSLGTCLSVQLLWHLCCWKGGHPSQTGECSSKWGAEVSSYQQAATPEVSTPRQASGTRLHAIYFLKWLMCCLPWSCITNSNMVPVMISYVTPSCCKNWVSPFVWPYREFELTYYCRNTVFLLCFAEVTQLLWECI